MNWKELEGIGRDLNEILSPDLPGVIEETHEKVGQNRRYLFIFLWPCIMISINLL
jgi:hypothetical protein